MKNILKLLVLGVLVITLLTSIMVFASSEIKVMLNGEYIQFDVKPQAINGRTMVPLRAIFEELGAEVEWDNNTKTVTATKDDTVVTTSLGSKIMYIDGEQSIIDVEPVAINGRILVPARFVAEAFDCDVDWDGDTKTVYIWDVGKDNTDTQTTVSTYVQIGEYLYLDNQIGQAVFEVLSIDGHKIEFIMTYADNSGQVVEITTDIWLNEKGYGIFENIYDSLGNKNSGYVQFVKDEVTFKLTSQTISPTATYSMPDVEFRCKY